MEISSALKDAVAASVPAKKAVKSLDITVLMGGPSSEREVSLVSGNAVADALARGGHKVSRADILPSDLHALDSKSIDVVFIALHGDFGESGQVQQLCEQRRLRYTGSPPRASELAIDKAASKQIFRRAGLATPDWALIEEFDDIGRDKLILAQLGLPLVIKPVDGGSSVDITIARRHAQAQKALEEMLDKYGRALVERFVAGRELTVGILGDRPLPIVEIRATREFYDYAAKYSDDAGTAYILDHQLPDKTVHAIWQAALTAHRSLGCRDMSRVDFLLDDSGTPQLLEINTIPGFTSHSLLPMAAAHAGISFDQLVQRIVDMAMQR